MGEMMMQMIPVVAARGNVVHVLDPKEAHKSHWEPGRKAKALCGREAIWYFSGVILEDDYPCVRCEKLTNVPILMFEADENMRMVAEAHKVVHYQMWLQHGQAMGWISEPSCYFHGVVPLTHEEGEAIETMGEPDHCIMFVRLYAP